MHFCLKEPPPDLFAKRTKGKACTHLECVAHSDPAVQLVLDVLGGRIESVTPIKVKLVKKPPNRPVITRR